MPGDARWTRWQAKANKKADPLRSFIYAKK